MATREVQVVVFVVVDVVVGVAFEVKVVLGLDLCFRFGGKWLHESLDPVN